jgi:hypothetical protein
MPITPVNRGAFANDPTADTLYDAFGAVNTALEDLDGRGLDDLSDVALGAIGPLEDGDTIVYDTSVSPPAWRNGRPSVETELGGLADVDLSDSPGPSDGDVLTYDASASPPVWRAEAPAAASGSATIVPPQGRLTLTSGVPVMNADATAQGTIYYTPHVGGSVPIYNGAAWAMSAFTQRTLTLNSTDNVSGSLHDIFIFDNAGTLTLGTGPAWTSSTARGTGAGTTELELKDGIWTNKVSITLKAGGSTVGTPAANRATYLGTIYCTANGQTGMAFQPAGASGGSNPILGLYNAYNRVMTHSVCLDSGVDYTYNSTTARAARASNSNRVSWVDGLQQSRVLAENEQVVYSNGAVGVGYIGVFLDATSGGLSPSGGGGSTNATGAMIVTAAARKAILPQLGFHFAQRGEAVSTGTANFGAGSAGPPALQNNNLTLSLEM